MCAGAAHSTIIGARAGRTFETAARMARMMSPTRTIHPSHANAIMAVRTRQAANCAQNARFGQMLCARGREKRMVGWAGVGASTATVKQS